MPTFNPAKLAAWSGGRWTRSPGGAVVGFNQDTRALTPGQMFVALKAGQRDGHDFLGEARARGAAAALVARETASVDLPQLVVADPLKAFQQIAGAHRREFSRGPVIGVTGSAGKTSTKDLLSLLLDEAGPVSVRSGSRAETGSARVLKTEDNLNKSAGAADATAPVRLTVLKTEGNFNNHIGVPLTLTRLDPAAHTAAVIEAGISGPGEMRPLAAMIQPDHAIVTLVGPAHLEGLGSVEGVAAEKVGLLTAVQSGGWQVFPVSCWAFEAFRRLGNPLVLVPANEDMVAVGGRAVRFTVLHRPERTEVTLGGRRTFILRRVSGGMAQNAALALALASELGVSDAQLQERLAEWQPSKWRGELQRVGEALVYGDFYNANPASMQDAIAAFSGQVKPELPRLYVLGCMEELGAGAADYHRQLGRSLLLRPGDFAFILGLQADAVREGLLENGNDPAQIAVIADVAPVRERLAGFKGAVFLKASRRYRLENVLDPHAATAAH